MTRWRCFTLVAAALGCGCTPSLSDRPWLVDEPAVLAIVAEPAEARPGAAVALQALVVDPDAPVPPPVSWRVCTEPRAAHERTAVSEACLLGDALAPVVTPAALPSDSCARFGPNPPPTMGDEPQRRPADPDPSGGYYVPYAAVTEPQTSFFMVRVRCDLAGATRPLFEQFEARYTTNLNPVIEAAGPIDDGAAGPITLRVDLAADAHEPYVVYDEANARIVEREEVLSVRWYVTGGELSRGRQTIESGARAEVEWTPDADGEPGRGWVVVTDDRGGAAFAAFELPP